MSKYCKLNKPINGDFFKCVICEEPSDGLYYKHIRHREQKEKFNGLKGIYICQKCFRSIYRDIKNDKVEFITENALIKRSEKIEQERQSKLVQYLNKNTK